MFQQASLMTEDPHLCGNDGVFKQDNATLHITCLITTFFHENNITLSETVFIA